MSDKQSSTTAASASASASAAANPRSSLTRREREILGLLAEGMSGAQIAGKLVLSPETVRTHVRNAMSKLGASTRSQAVVMAMQANEIAGDLPPAAAAAAASAGRPASNAAPAAPPAAALVEMLGGLVSLYDVDGGAVYLAEEDGLSLRRIAESGGEQGPGLEEVVALGEGPLGRAALDRRAQMLQDAGADTGRGAILAAPIVNGGRLLGVIALSARISRPVGRSEMLLLQAFANRVGEVISAGGDVTQRLERAMDRFRTSWSAATRAA